MIPLDHADAAQRLGEPASDLGVNLAALAKNRPDSRERLVERHRKAYQRADRDERHLRAGAEQQNERNSGGDQSAGKIHEAGAQQITHALHIAHDAGNQATCLVDVVKCNRKAGNMSLYLLTQFRDQTLRRLR